MLSYTITALATLAGLAAASPTPQGLLPVATNPTYFSLIAISSGSLIHQASINAANSSLWANYGNQGAVCEGQDPTSAIFTLTNGTLNLYTPSTAAPQVFWVDRSHLGQGAIGYTTGTQLGPPLNAERGTWSNVNGYLLFNDLGLMACPVRDGSWGILVQVGGKVGGHCIAFAARVLEIPESSAVACRYSISS